MLQAAFPFGYRPAGIAILCQPGENPAEIDLPVAQQAEAAGAIDPVLKAAIDPRSPGRVELGVLDVEHADPLVINVDELQIVERLQHIMAGIIEDVGTRMIIDAGKEALEGTAVVEGSEEGGGGK